MIVLHEGDWRIIDIPMATQLIFGIIDISYVDQYVAKNSAGTKLPEIAALNAKLIEQISADEIIVGVNGLLKVIPNLKC